MLPFDLQTSLAASVMRAAIITILACSLGFLAMTAQQSVVDLHGSPDQPLSQGQGKIVVLVFVRTDCPVANRYAPLVQQIQKQYSPETVSFRLVFPDRNESVAAIREYLQQYGYHITAIRDLDHALVKKASARTTPEAAVFNATGQLIYHGRIDNLYERIGQSRRAATTHELADAIEAASQGRKPAVSTTDAVGCFISDVE